MKNIIPKGTAAASWEKESKQLDNNWKVRVDGDLGSDTIGVFFVGSSGALTAPTDDFGSDVVLSASNRQLEIPKGSGVIRIVKGVTTNEVGVDLAGMD